MHVQPFSKMDPTLEPGGCMSRLIMGWGPLLFWPPEAFLWKCRRGSLPWPQEWAGPLSLYSSRAQLLPLALSLECLGERTKLEFYSTWQTPGVRPNWPPISDLSLNHWTAGEIPRQQQQKILFKKKSVYLFICCARSLLWHVGSLSYGIWDWFPWPGMELGPAVLRVWRPSHWTPRKSPHYLHMYITLIKL